MSKSTTYVPCPAGRSCRYGATRHEEGSPKLDACRRIARLDGRAVGASVSVAPPRPTAERASATLTATPEGATRVPVPGSRDGVDVDPDVVRRASASIDSSIIVSTKRGLSGVRDGVEVAPPHVLGERPGHEVLASRATVRAHVGRADAAVLAARSPSGGVANGPLERTEVYEVAARTLAAEVSALRALVVGPGEGSREGEPSEWFREEVEDELVRVDSELALVRSALTDLDRAYEDASLATTPEVDVLWSDLVRKNVEYANRRAEVVRELDGRATDLDPDDE